MAFPLGILRAFLIAGWISCSIDESSIMWARHGQWSCSQKTNEPKYELCVLEYFHRFNTYVIDVILIATYFIPSWWNQSIQISHKVFYQRWNTENLSLFDDDDINKTKRAQYSSLEAQKVNRTQWRPKPSRQRQCSSSFYLYSPQRSNNFRHFRLLPTMDERESFFRRLHHFIMNIHGG